MRKGFFVVVAVLSALALVGTVLLGTPPAVAKMRYVTIGTGGVTGVYYPLGGAISKIVNKKKSVHKVRVSVESTGGSVFNVNAVMAGDLEFGIVQSDRQYQAWYGLKEWKDVGPQKDLRAICSFHPESVTLVAAVEAGIKTFYDLKGKRVNIGNPGSGQRGNSIDVLTAAGIDWQKDIVPEGLKAAEAPKMLQDGRIDAFFYTVGHPSGAIKEATSGRRKVRFIPIPDDVVKKLTDKFPYYAPAIIPIKFYPMAENKEDVPTFGVKATFVTSIKVPEDIV
ncbi:MAG: C4-dicarboxylate ABC transporter substrate-binding protein, partial [Deltaproteobacteria bacterium]